MRDLLINLLASAIMTLATLAYSRLTGINGNDSASLWGGVAAIVVVASSITTLYFNRRRNQFLAAQKFDFKFFADTKNDGGSAVSTLFEMFGKTSFDTIGVDPLFASARTIKGFRSETYISASDFFSSSNAMLREFRCRSVRNQQKTGKVFLQLSFIPIDEEGNTILIQRQDVYHPRQFGFRFKKDMSFISFSPIPPRYASADFTVLDSYHNEVPDAWNGQERSRPEIEELGAVIRRSGGAVYVFWVFAVRYQGGVHFTGPTAKETIKGLFYENEEAFRDKKAFVKDHDKIVAVARVDVLKAYALSGTLPELKGGPLSGEFWRNVKLRFLLRRTEIKPAEKCVLQNLV